MGTIEKVVQVVGGHFMKKEAKASVFAVQWNKDGDHPQVERYPIEGREYKGLLRVKMPRGEQDLEFHLRFGDWIVEDGKKQYVVCDEQFQEEYVEVKEKVEAPKEAGFMSFCMSLLLMLAGAAAAYVQWIGGIKFVTHLMYYSAIKGQWDNTSNGVFNLGSGGSTMKVSAHTNTYSPNQDTHDFFDDVTNEVSGTNYTAGGATLANKALTRSTGTVTWDADDVVWLQNAAGFSTGRKFVIYLSTGTASTSRLFSVVTADADVGNVTGDLTIQWNASGIAQWTTT